MKSAGLLITMLGMFFYFDLRLKEVSGGNAIQPWVIFLLLLAGPILVLIGYIYVEPPLTRSKLLKLLVGNNFVKISDDLRHHIEMFLVSRRLTKSVDEFVADAITVHLMQLSEPSIPTSPMPSGQEVQIQEHI